MPPPVYAFVNQVLFLDEETAAPIRAMIAAHDPTSSSALVLLERLVMQLGERVEPSALPTFLAMGDFSEQDSLVVHLDSPMMACSAQDGDEFFEFDRELERDEIVFGEWDKLATRYSPRTTDDQVEPPSAPIELSDEQLDQIDHWSGDFMITFIQWLGAAPSTRQAFARIMEGVVLALSEGIASYDPDEHRDA